MIFLLGTLLHLRSVYVCVNGVYVHMCMLYAYACICVCVCVCVCVRERERERERERSPAWLDKLRHCIALVSLHSVLVGNIFYFQHSSTPSLLCAVCVLAAWEGSRKSCTRACST
jgi:L-asparagine transporter-like permease